MTHHRLPRFRTKQPPPAPSFREALPAREALRRALAELEKCQAAFDCHCGDDSDRLRMEIRLAEQRVEEARAKLRKIDPTFDR